MRASPFHGWLVHVMVFFSCVAVALGAVDSTSDASNPLNVVNQLSVSAVISINDILEQAMDPVQELYVQYARGESVLPADAYLTLVSYILERSNIRGIYVGTASGYMHWFETLLGKTYNNTLGCGTDINWAQYNTTTTQW